ncbi:ARS binding protein 2-domain-containing protein [Lipomyces orientalis]|uniref:ARS binding protein 2-domain-containing protein n=1 Tax=Lipomyces orientalis TaxID=1233043 RepID=A0ACC3TU71_9ASCO
MARKRKDSASPNAPSIGDSNSDPSGSHQTDELQPLVSSQHQGINDHSDYYYPPGSQYPAIVNQQSPSSITNYQISPQRQNQLQPLQQQLQQPQQQPQQQQQQQQNNQQDYPYAFHSLYGASLPDDGSDSRHRQEHYAHERLYISASYSQQLYRQPDSLLSLSQSHEFSLASNPEVQHSGRQPLPPPQEQQLLAPQRLYSQSPDPLLTAPLRQQSQSRTTPWPIYLHPGSGSGASVEASSDSSSESVPSSRNQSGFRHSHSPTQSQARHFALYNPRHISLSSSSASSPGPRNAEPSRRTSDSSSPVELSTASAVAVRGAKMYLSASPSTSSSVAGSQSIFHSNPDLDRRVAAAVAPQPRHSSYTPQDRSLPPIPTLDETTPIGDIEDAYVQFILYCNPALQLDVDAADLRRAFRNVPKSDGKAFEVNRLLVLLRQFETGEIRTWTRLVTELGVERTPEQSAQKVQQYAVRLKRWMRAMHIDTFFEFCMGHTHAYFTQIPDPSEPTPAGRDGVPTEEDLALRALLPELRQRRPRLATAPSNEQVSQHSLGQETNASRPSLPIDTEAPQEQHTQSPTKERYTVNRSESSSSTCVSTTSSSSATGKRRKRHGPAVSSAWITQNPSGRGRPATVTTQQQQQEAEETESRLRVSLERKLADSGVMRFPFHAQDIAAQIVKGFRTGLRSTGVADGAAFAWVFGGVDGIDNIDFDVQLDHSDCGIVNIKHDDDLASVDPLFVGSTTTYVVGWRIDLGGATAKFNRTVTVANNGMTGGPNKEI